MYEIQFVVITGLSGAGKTIASRCFEDLGFFCIDNLPPVLIPQFAELCAKSDGKIRKAALVIDAREKDTLYALFTSLEIIKSFGDVSFEYKILFLEANPKVLIRRFKEARLQHPSKPGGTIIQGIKEEKKKLKEIRSKANFIIDTSEFTPWDLKREISKIFAKTTGNEINVNIISFGYKFGLPLDADSIFDVRFLPNPNYIGELSSYTGIDKPAKEFVLNSEITKEFLAKFYALIDYVIPYNIQEGKSILNIGIGCTGGRHRSVVIAEGLAKHLKKKYKIQLIHRDVHKR